ncbi:MAG: response regulator [Candidatus Zixiibacteriota bacterium]
MLMKEAIEILVIDDESEARRTIVEMLKMAGFSATSVSSGAEALEYLRGHQIDLVICDVIMPGMDGFAVLKGIKIDFPDIKVVLITGSGDAEAIRKAFLMGADEFITKPFDAQELSLVVERVCWHLTPES